MRDRRVRGERREEETRAELTARADEALGRLPARPTVKDMAGLLGIFREEYTQFATRNAERLDHINHAYRRMAYWVVVVGVLVAVAQIGLGVLGLRLQVESDATVTQVQQGRKLALRVSCAVQSAVAQAGREVLAGPASPPPEEHALEALGFPPFKVRHAQQEQAARAYVRNISDAIDGRIGSKGDKLVRSDGTLDCKRLLILVHAGADN